MLTTFHMKSTCQLLVFTILLSGCSKTLEEKPYSLAEEVFYNTPAEVAAGANAMYTPLRDVGSMGALYTVQLETYGDYIFGRGSHEPLNNYAGLDANNLTRIDGFWRLFYRSVRNANIIIKRAPQGNQISPQDIAKFTGEAKFMRALNYFHLVRNWAGVPIRTEKNMEVTDVKRSSVAEVYDLIVADLKDAETNLPETPRLPGTPSKWAAKTLLADVYLNMTKYPEARDKALEVIQSNKYALVKVSTADDFEKIFGAEAPTTSEEIFYLKYSRKPDGQGFPYVKYAHAAKTVYFPPGGYYTNYTDTILNPIMKNWNKSDLRYRHNWYPVNFGLGNTTVLNCKFRDPQANGDNNAGNDYPLYRYSELLLLYAEADNRVNNGPGTDALEKLNMVHRRAYGADPLIANASLDFTMANFASAQAFTDTVAKERMYETAYEGKRWLDLKRLGTVKQAVLDAKGKTVADKHLLWPIPMIETNYNKAIDPGKDQNPGY